MNGTVDEMNSPVKGVHEDGQKSVHKEDNLLPSRRTEKLWPIFKSEAEVYLGNTQPKKTSEAQKRKRVPRKTAGVMGVATEKSRSCLRGWLTTLPKSSSVVDSSRKHMCSSSHKSEDILSRDKTTAVRRGSILCGVMRCGTCGNKMTRENTRETTRLPDGRERHMVTTGWQCSLCDISDSSSVSRVPGPEV